MDLDPPLAAAACWLRVGVAAGVNAGCVVLECRGP